MRLDTILVPIVLTSAFMLPTGLVAVTVGIRLHHDWLFWIGMALEAPLYLLGMALLAGVCYAFAMGIFYGIAKLIGMHASRNVTLEPLMVSITTLLFVLALVIPCSDALLLDRSSALLWSLVFLLTHVLAFMVANFLIAWGLDQPRLVGAFGSFFLLLVVLLFGNDERILATFKQASFLLLTGLGFILAAFTGWRYRKDDAPRNTANRASR